MRGKAAVQIYTPGGGDLMCGVNDALEQCFSEWLCVLYVCSATTCTRTQTQSNAANRFIALNTSTVAGSNTLKKVPAKGSE